MTQNELRNQELIRHEEQVDRGVERNQALNLHEKNQSIARANQNSSVARIVNIVYLLFGALELLLTVRVVLHVVGVNPANGFANFVYTLSAPFTALFSTLVQNPTLGAGGVLEVTTLFALVVYAIVAWLIGRMIWLVLSRPR